jgi:hypothetical protein
MIVRDPRDVLASLDHGRGGEYMGRRKPPLFNLRQWRTSVAFALHYRDHERCAMIRYEDLVGSVDTVGAQLTALLAVAPFDPAVLAGELEDREGAVWWSNSSHHRMARVSTASVGKHRDLLDEWTARWIEAVCYPEMLALGYQLTIDEAEIPGILAGESAAVCCRRPDLERPELASFCWHAQRRQEELERHRAFQRGSFAPELFVFEDLLEDSRPGPETTEPPTEPPSCASPS